MLSIKNLTPNVYYSTDASTHIVDFRKIKVGDKAIAELEVDTRAVKDFETKATCGCSSADDEETVDGKTKITLQFKNTYSPKSFNKVIELLYNGKKEILRIKGTVEN